ncbi:MAG TPA: hypothetical protein VM101_16735 [Flavitalea sp.]|nr:hypothetical protein [Flavitalea sp.]
MKRALALLLIVLFYISAKPLRCNKSNAEDLKGVQVTFHQQVPFPDGSIKAYEDVSNIFYYKNCTVYKYTYSYDKTSNGKLITAELRDYFILHHNDSTYGYRVDSRPDGMYPTERLHIDSILGVVGFQTKIYDSLISVPPDSTFTNAEKDLVKMYRGKPSKSIPANYRLYFYYTKELSWVREKLSAMDNQPDYKLFKMQNQTDSAYYEQIKQTLPPLNGYREMKEIAEKSQPQIIELVNRYLNRSLR